jgi:hypothetical protein
MTSRSGGLLELVARGKKDLFFTANPQTSFFHSVYVRAAAFTKEIYLSTPRNAPEWGRVVDFDIEHRGDLVKHFYLRITLPTWLPPEAAAVNPTGLVTDASGVTFGWCNNIGFQMIEKIQIYQDQVILAETYGEFLDWRLRQSYGFTTTYLVAQEIGSRPETALGIARSATVGTLRVPFPVLGWQNLSDPGLPLCALKKQRFRIRVHLRKLEELVVASDGRLKPQPWGGMPLNVQATASGPVDTSLTTMPYGHMLRGLTMMLEQTEVYVPADVQTWFKAQAFRIPFQTVQYQRFTLEDNTMTAAALNPAATYTVPLNVDFIGSTDRMLLGFRSAACTEAGQRTLLRATNGKPFIRTARLNIANIDRIKAWPVPIFREVAAYWKSTRMGLNLVDPTLPQEIYTLSLGGFDSAQPAGTLNLTRAVLPVLYVTLNGVPYDERNTSRQTFALLYAETWNVFEVQNGEGYMKFDDS